MNQVDISIRKVEMEELGDLQKIARTTFIESFGSLNTEENLTSYLSSSFSTTQLKSELLANGSIFYFVEIDQKIIGYLKVNFDADQSEQVLENSLEIERIYLLGSHQGMGIGQVLFDFAIDYAKAQSYSSVWLGVWDRNTQAIKFYERNGFEKFDEHTFMLGSEKQTDIMMMRSL